jgi:hypothetical protein
MTASFSLSRMVCCLAVTLLSACRCDPGLPQKPAECALDEDCLPDETCEAQECTKRPPCETDEECPSPAWQCVRPAQFCALRPGFGEECSSSAPCAQGQICELGVCVPLAEQRPCSRAADCPTGQRCSQTTFTCLQDVNCSLSDSFPEVACDIGEQCDAFVGTCRLPCQNECTPQSDECGSGLLCDGSCRCVQCLFDSDCGLGLLCNQRSGRCQPENLCYDDSDCEDPLICDATTALCQQAPPPCASDFDCAIAEICNLDNGQCQSPTGACDDDYLEDTDTPATPEERTLIVGDVEVLDDLRLCPDDDDIFAIAMLSGETLVADIEGTTPAARATLWVLDSQAATSLAFAEAPPRGSGRVNYTSSVDEVIYLRINALLAQSPYALRLEKRAGAACTDDFFEGETSNDSLAQATPQNLVPLDIPLSASICPRDVDHYQVDVAAGESLTARLQHDPARGDLDIDFLDVTTGEVLAEAKGGLQPALLAQRFTNARTVVVRVRGFGNAIGSYTLTLGRGAPFVCNDGLEPDVPTPALDLVNGVTQNQTRALCTDESDAWEVVLEDFERLVVSTTTTDPDLRIDLEASVDNVVVAQGVRSPGVSTLVWDANVAVGEQQTVVVRARGRDGSVGDYQVGLRKQNQTACEADSSEPNDRSEDAVAVPASSSVLSICGSDGDFFTIEANAGRRITVDANFQHALGDIDLMLLGLDGLQVLDVSDGVGNNEHIELVAPLDGVYRLRVFSLTNNARNIYTLDVDVEQ